MINFNAKILAMAPYKYFTCNTEFGTIRCVLNPLGAISALTFQDEEDSNRLFITSSGLPIKIDVPEWFSIEYLIKGFRSVDHPLDFGRATDFQKMVWNAAMSIPYGETVTYSQLAEMVGRPRAQRAVANALAANKIAVIVPCHRVIRRDGLPGGYKWGAARKMALLDFEKKMARKE